MKEKNFYLGVKRVVDFVLSLIELKILVIV